MAGEGKQRIRVVCPHCGATAKAPVEYAGRRVKCAAKECRKSFDIPSSQGSAPKSPLKSEIPKKPKPPASPIDNPYEDDDFFDDDIPSAPASTFSTTVASNPGRVRFNPLQWCRHQPLALAISLGSAILVLLIWLGLVMSGHCGTLATKDGGQTPIWLFSPAILATWAFFTWIRSRKFGSGDANPGVVVALNPTLIAVATDLSQGVGEFPAVKILRTYMKTAGGKPIEIGTRIPTIALYAQPHDKSAGHWSDFHPEPAEYATGDQKVLTRLLASFSKEQYAFLEQALKAIEKPFAPGLYAMWTSRGKKAGRRIEKGKDF